jgi:hypothetical protein
MPMSWLRKAKSAARRCALAMVIGRRVTAMPRPRSSGWVKPSVRPEEKAGLY